MMQAIKAFGEKIQTVIAGGDLGKQETYDLFRELLLNRQPDLQQGALLAALAAKGETAGEIAGAMEAILELDTVQPGEGLPRPLTENSGTGMDGQRTFNVSSAAAVIAAARGVKMARHCARAITSLCGAVDIMEAAGVDMECRAETVDKSIRNAGIGIYNGMSARIHPSALFRILGQIRFGSVLNIAASLANPARPTVGVRGVWTPKMIAATAEVMRGIGYEKGLVFCGAASGEALVMDEISVSGPTLVTEFRDGEERTYELTPEDFGIKNQPFAELVQQENLETEAKRFVDVLSGKRHTACRAYACANASAILYLSGKCGSYRQGFEMAMDAISSGAAVGKLMEWVLEQNENPKQGMEKLMRLRD
ncbi:MAG: anthranilate phosphoribosyltransferase [Thermodesulfobacteriota bacterium]